jgi:hypothetical protein
VMGIDKRSGNPQDSFNQTGGVDTRLVFFKDWIVDAHAAGTNSPVNISGASGSATDVGASLSYRSNWLDGIVERRKIGPNFNPEVGFIERTDSNVRRSHFQGQAQNQWRTGVAIRRLHPPRSRYAQSGLYTGVAGHFPR